MVEATTAHCEFFQPGEIFQLDTPLSSAATESSGRQFEALFGDGDRHGANGDMESALGWRRAMTTGLESGSNSSSSEDDNDEDRMGFEPMIVHSDYPDIYNGGIVAPLAMSFSEYSANSGHAAKLNHHSNYYHQIPSTVSYRPQTNPPTPVIMNSKYPLNPGADYLGLVTPDGAEEQSATWKYANSGAPTSPSPPPYPLQPAAMALTSKYQDLNEVQESRTFATHQGKEAEFRLQYSPPLRGVVAPSAVATGGEAAAKYADFGEALLL